MATISQKKLNRKQTPVTSFNEGDIVVSHGFSVSENGTPFRTVTDFRVKNFLGLVRLDNKLLEVVSSDYRLATDEDYKLHEKISKSITYLVDGSNHEDQHISSFDGKDKLGHNDEMDAYKSAYKMCYRDGGKWLIYQCNVCQKFHIGKNLENN